MEITLKGHKQEEKQVTLTFSQWMLYTIKKHKKRTNTDAAVGLVVAGTLFFITLM
ncbi:hypothetical protein JSY36_07850 [Bacillus sp. H-16]|uniref:hypothetical protein n=1 Tax=Alteribacter salitolerans TaxID=2912333 RepID=UPI001965DE88|nr:hypothetical protein [Alteribacter salitolerans]MBM7095664.1 hypothetical protein [Alteribacter salitolerans]